MPQLPLEWAELLGSGVSHRLGAVDASGEPLICRALASLVRADGRIEVVFGAEGGQAVEAAVRTSRRIAYVAAQPVTLRTLHVKGLDAQAVPVDDAHTAAMRLAGDRFFARISPFGFSWDYFIGMGYTLPASGLRALRFSPAAAWNQTPGPGAGQSVALQP